MSNITEMNINGTIYPIGAKWENISNKPELSSYAPKVSPALTGVPTAPTASSGTNTTQIATTAFVNSAVDSAKSNTYTKAETEQLITHKESLLNKVQSINSQSQTFDNVNYPSVTAVRDYVNTKTDDLQDYIENELDELGEAKADKTEVFDAVVRNYKDVAADITFNIHNTKVDEFLQTAAYDSSDYSYSNLPAADGTNWDRPNTTTINIPSGSSKIVFYDTVTKAERVESTSGTTHTVDNLIPNRNYAYTVRNSRGEMLTHGIIKATGQLRMINAGGDDAGVDRTFNIRDLGGWTATGGKLKYGLVYRGGELNGSISISSAQQAFFKDVLGIRHEIDLRDNGEPGVGATALGCGVNYYHLATGRSPYILGDNDTYAKKRADVIKQLAKNIKNGEPTYIHCQAGADRTGVMCVFLKAICGVSQSDIDRDQELSYYSYQADAQRVRKRNNMWANGHRVMINGTGAEDYSQPYINNMEGSSFQDKIIRLLLRSGVTIDELNDIRFGLIDGNPTALTNPYSNATVTTTLTNVYVDQSVSSVDLYQPLEINLAPKDGYVLSSVSLTMGGTDVKSSYYKNGGKISIPRVTGNVAITAQATYVLTA